jgi:hypothetical protein
LPIFVVHTPARDQVTFLCQPHMAATLSQNPRLVWTPARFRKHCDVCHIRHS